VAWLNPGAAETLTVPGRRSGLPRRVPAIPVEVDGSRYLVSPYGESGWVLDLRASGTAELSHRGTSRTVRAVEMRTSEREPVSATYRQAVSRTVGTYFDAARRRGPPRLPARLTLADFTPTARARAPIQRAPRWT
jgi:hypothetical protein